MHQLDEGIVHDVLAGPVPNDLGQRALGAIDVAHDQEHYSQIAEHTHARDAVFVQLEGTPFVRDRLGGLPSRTQHDGDPLVGAGLGIGVG